MSTHLRLTAISLFGVIGCAPDTQIYDNRIGNIELEPAYVDFGTLTVGGQVEVTRTLRNAGSRSIGVTGISCTDAEQVTTVEPLEGVQLGPAGSGTDYYDVIFRYTPDVATTLQGRCRVDFSGATETSVSVGLFGRAVPAAVEFIPAVIDFGRVQNGTEVIHATLKNFGLAPVTLSEFSYSSDGLFLYSVPSDGTALAPDDEVEITISTSTLEIADDLLVASFLEGGSAELPIQANNCESPLVILDNDGDGFTECAGDCDDEVASIRPGAPELPDGINQDCDDLIDEGTIAFDDDGDGFTENEGDCNDQDILVYPDSPHVIEGADYNCDGFLEGQDNDGDGYNIAAGDCDDTDPTVGPGEIELPNGIDDDCDETIDEETIAYDDDNDGFTENEGDCDDSNIELSPIGIEDIDGKDDDCNGLVDDGTAAYDDDGDGFNEQGGDCDDTDEEIHPAVLDVVGDGVDDNCDGVDGML